MNLLISLDNFKIWAQKIKFLKLKYTFCRLLDSAPRGYRTTPLPSPPLPTPTAPLQLPFAFRTLLIVPKISGEFFNNFGYKLVNFVTVVVVCTVTTVTTVTVDTSIIRTAVFSVVTMVILFFRYVWQWLLWLLQSGSGASVTHVSHVHDVDNNTKRSLRTSEYPVSWSPVVDSIAAFISPQEVIFSVFTNYPLSTPTYFSLIPFDLSYSFPLPLFVLPTDSLPTLSSSPFFRLKLSLTPLFFQYSFRNFIFFPPFTNIPFPLLWTVISPDYKIV